MGFLSHCTVTIASRTVGSVGNANNGSNTVVEPEVEVIEYTSSGGNCGMSGTNGASTGESEVNRFGGGSTGRDPCVAPQDCPPNPRVPKEYEPVLSALTREYP